MYVHHYRYPHGELTLNLLSDLHIGSPETDYDAIKRDLARPGRFLLNGDIFDAIVASDTKRFRPGGIHTRLRGRTDILNGAIDWAEELLRPVADRIDLLGIGNHESAIEHHASVDLGLMLADRLGVPYGGYTGFVEYRFTDRSRHTRRFVIFYHHGAGGGASASGAIGEFQKKMGFVDADLIWIGHKHFRITSHMRRLSCPLGGKSPRYDETRFVMTGAYMDTWTSQRGRPRNSSYAEDRGLPPQGKGGARVVLRTTPHTLTTEVIL